MTLRYEAYVDFIAQLDAVRWNMIGLACAFGLGRVFAGRLPQKWAAPAYEALVLIIVYTVMVIGMMQ